MTTNATEIKEEAVTKIHEQKGKNSSRDDVNGFHSYIQFEFSIFSTKESIRFHQKPKKH